jgi:hypothetical protein
MLSDEGGVDIELRYHGSMWLGFIFWVTVVLSILALTIKTVA